MSDTEKTLDPFELIDVVTPETGEIVRLSRGFVDSVPELKPATEADYKKAEKKAETAPAKPSA